MLVNFTVGLGLVRESQRSADKIPVGPQVREAKVVVVDLGKLVKHVRRV